jgi:hypothetical protein
MKARQFVVAALVGGMALAIPATSAFADGHGLLGGVLGGSSGLLGGSGCNEDEIVSVGGDAGLVGVNLAGDLDTDHGVLGLFTGSEDELLSVGGDSGLVALNNGLDTDHGLVGLNLAPCDD